LNRIAPTSINPLGRLFNEENKMDKKDIKQRGESLLYPAIIAAFIPVLSMLITLVAKELLINSGKV
jgi:hypothetical protein